MDTQETDIREVTPLREDEQVPEGWRHIYAADLQPRRFDVPYHPGDFVSTRALDAAQDERINSGAVTFREGAAKIDTLQTYLAACEACIADFQLGGKSFGSLKDNEQVYRKLTPVLRDWLKERMAEMNPSLMWAERPFESASSGGSRSA